ncbi:MAG TPA: hypothetical protein VG605_10515, partial [Puia sp.]|nr:hypothetical protein [Puia sp.]
MVPQNQLDATLARWKERKDIRSRNLRMIQEKRYFDIDNPARVQNFLSRRGFSAGDAREIMKVNAGFPELAVSETPGTVLSLERI